MAASNNASYRNSFENTFSCEAIIIAMPQARPEHFVGQIWQEISIS